MNKPILDGIYLNLSFEDYLAAPRLSSSELSAMIESPSAYWAQTAMNPDREEKEPSPAMILGSAYHCARLEPEEFLNRYCRELVKEDLPNALTNGTQIGEELASMGHPKKKAGESVMGQALRLDHARREGGFGDPETMPAIWPLILELWEKDVKQDRIAIAPKAWEEIKRDAQRIRDIPEVATKLAGGRAEVSIFWTEPETGIKCKCRPDYLGPDFITHLKTWDLKNRGKPGNDAVRDNFMYSDHHLTGWFYQLALSRIAPDNLVMRNNKGVAIKHKDLNEPDQDLWEAWREAEFSTNFLYVRRSGIPDIRLREIKFFRLPKGVDEQKINADTSKFRREPTALAVKADMEIMACFHTITDCSEIYGRDGAPWYPRDIVADLEDEDFPLWWLDRTPRLPR